MLLDAAPGTIAAQNVPTNYQAAIALYIDGFEKIVHADPHSVEASINANMPYATFSGMNLGQLFVFAGEIAGFNTMNEETASIMAIAKNTPNPPPGSPVL